MKKRHMDKLASKVGKAGELVADRQTAKTLEFVERPIINDEKINVLVLGASGAGKSTLINAVLGKERAKVGDGSAVTKKLKLYERKDLPFRMIDTPGLEYSISRQEKIKRQLADWSEEGLTRKDLEHLVHVIWFCIDAQSKRVSKESLNYLYRISKLWKGIPIVVVFTKSYSKDGARENEAMFKKVMSRYSKKKKLNVSGVVSILAKELEIDSDITIGSYGLEELTAVTVDLIPDAKEINVDVMTDMSYQMRRKAAGKFVTAAQKSAFTVAVLPTRHADAEFLEPIQESMLDKVAEAFVLTDDEKASMLETVESAKVVVKAGKKVAGATRRIPLVNGFIANRVTGAIGRVAIRSAEKLSKARNS